jgi:cytochrome c553
VSVKQTYLIVAGLVSLLVSGHGLAAEPADLARAEEIVGGRCFLCHGMEGESASPIFPRLAGQHSEYIAKQLSEFKSGKRKSDTMKPQAEDLTPDEMKALGAFFEAKTPASRPARDPELLAVGKFIFSRGNPFSGVPACATCHGPRGLGTPQLPRLAGQHPRYTEDQLKQFNSRERNNDNAVMHTVASKLTDFERNAVAEYVATLD